MDLIEFVRSHFYSIVELSTNLIINEEHHLNKSYGSRLFENDQ
jgi:hypothetical protein